MVKVLTYGTFDAFHYGHLELLIRAKSFGDWLIVGLSTDAFNEIKGKQSKFDYEIRKKWLESIKCVDQIIPETSWHLKVDDILINNVNLFIMGDDWRGRFDDLPCEVRYLERTPNISSTDIKNILSGG